MSSSIAVFGCSPYSVRNISTCDNLSIILGDLGIDKGTSSKKLLNGRNVKFIYGDMDNMPVAKSDNRCIGDFGYLNNQNTFAISGTDREDRPWFTKGQVESMMALYQKSRPKIVVSHDGPSWPLYNMFGVVNGDNKYRTTACMDELLKLWEPKYWIFSHWNKKGTFVSGRTTFVSLDESEDILLSC